MLIQPPVKSDFDFGTAIETDVERRGFTNAEMEFLAGSQLAQDAGSRGFWNRQPTPEIRELKSQFGYQTKPLLTDLIAAARAQKTELGPMVKAKAAKNNFYIMRCGVFISPDAGERFEALKFEVRYDDRASTFTMMPGPQANKLLEIGGKAEIGVTGELDFGFAGDVLANLKAEAAVKATVETNFIVSFHYELKTQVIDSYGTGNSFCRWLMHKGDQLRNDVVFYPIIVTPKSVTAFDCEFEAFFKVGHPQWKSSEFFHKPPRKVRVSA